MKKKTIVLILILFVFVIIVASLIWNKEANFMGSDEAGVQMIDEITKQRQEPWFSPVIEKILGGELSGEMETLFFCIQTGIGVGVIAFGFGYLVARKKYDQPANGAKKEGEQ